MDVRCNLTLELQKFNIQYILKNYIEFEGQYNKIHKIKINKYTIKIKVLGCVQWMQLRDNCWSVKQ